MTADIRRWVNAAQTLSETTVFTLPPDIAQYVQFQGSFDPTTCIAHIFNIGSSRKGYGRKAVTAFERWAKAQGAWKVTGQSVPQSLPFWWKLGYRDDRHYAIHKMLIEAADLRHWMTLIERERLCENANLLQITPAFVRAVRLHCNRIAADIADDLPRNNKQFADGIRAVVARIEQEEPLAPMMTVVRAELRPRESIPDGITSVGAHWSWSEAGAQVYHHDNAYDEYGRENVAQIILIAEVAFNSIDWPYTIATNLIHRAEQEITIKPGATVKLIEIFADIEGNGMDKWFDPKGRTADVDGTYAMD